MPCSSGFLIDAVTTLQSTAFESLTATEVAHRMVLVRKVQSYITSCEIQLLARNAVLHAEGKAPSPEATAAKSGSSARRARKVRDRAAAVDAVPELGDALADGDITGEHADILAQTLARASGAVRDRLIAHRSHFVDAARRLSVDEFWRYCHRQILLADTDLTEHDRHLRDTSLRKWIDPATGMYRISGHYDPETGARLFGAIDTETERIFHAGPTGRPAGSADQTAAHALTNLVAGGFTQTHPGKTELIAIIDLQTLLNGTHAGTIAEYGDGTQVPVSTLRRLCCDAHIIPTVLGGNSEILDLGRSQRLASHAQRRALRAQHRTCAIPNCAVPFDNCTIHHLEPWEHGGPTNIHKMIPACNNHHHDLHEGQWTYKIQPDQSVHWTRPDGTLDTDAPPPTLKPHTWTTAA